MIYSHSPVPSSLPITFNIVCISWVTSEVGRWEGWRAILCDFHCANRSRSAQETPFLLPLRQLGERGVVQPADAEEVSGVGQERL